MRYALQEAQSEELRVTGHACGHRFRIQVVSAGHYGILGEGPENHKDTDDFDEDLAWTLEVRAHSLSDAMMLAAGTPLPQWKQAYDESLED